MKKDILKVHTEKGHICYLNRDLFELYSKLFSVIRPIPVLSNYAERDYGLEYEAYKDNIQEYVEQLQKCVMDDCFDGIREYLQYNMRKDIEKEQNRMQNRI